ncbi:fumarylacetoacetate hydrolase [Chryseolinea serpens]|uniref:fumarylacetoacetase n=1 Tax=Chryseolinea serpens TaxID=947013 RepID=A0A1M5U878_9BACT|nr:fumarylacetoacetase [Chryseolinea serpens]SHH59187.1 fumarylacetoacetate hydrolase [Chryseolinea serpens]
MTNPNDPILKSWVPVPPHSDFPIQNLPFGIFRTASTSPRAGVAIGDVIVDLAALAELGFFKTLNLPSGIFSQSTLNDFFALGKKTIRNVRERISQLLRHDNKELSSHESVNKVLIPQNVATLLLPVRVPNYTDFYSSEEHATNVGSMFRDPKNALLPNWKHLPVGYHGRASSIVVSGTPIRRPRGQVKMGEEPPVFCPSHKLDFEVEMAFITCSETALGHPIHTHEAEEHIAGFALFNDWSARDIQQWEYVPLGPFLGKNFGSTLSPWIVTMDALEPFRVEGPSQNPHVLPYLSYAGKKNFDIVMEALIQPEGVEASVVCRTNFKYMYWNVNQQLAHHTVNGCNIQVGDVYASGTISGPSPGSFGSLLELSWNGQKSLHMADGTERTFLRDGDTVTLHAYAERDGVRIGFGACSGKILPSL